MNDPGMSPQTQTRDLDATGDPLSVQLPVSGNTEGSGRTSLRRLLAGYDDEVAASLREALEATTGLQRVRLLHSTRRSIAVHDAVLRTALCPLLEELPGGKTVADRLRDGCKQRAELLHRFDAVTKNVAAHNVYPVSGEEIEDILEQMERSFEMHLHAETVEVGDVLERAAQSVDPDVIAARMALEAQGAPTRIHRATTKHPSSSSLKGLYRFLDRLADWHDSHHGWLDPDATAQSPRAMQVTKLKDHQGAPSLTVRDVLAGYDQTVSAVIEEWETARTSAEHAEAAHRLSAAITVHDSVLGGVLSPLIAAVPNGKAVAARLREGCDKRAELLEVLYGLTDHVQSEDPSSHNGAQVDEVVRELIASFRSHEKEGTSEVTDLLTPLSADAYRTKTSPLSDAMWTWHSEGASLLALRMALWAQAAPTRTHPLLVRHPSSHALRFLYHHRDRWTDFWADSALERWLAPKHPAAPFSASDSRNRQSDT